MADSKGGLGSFPWASVAVLLASAREAMDDLRLTRPEDRSALFYYDQVLVIEPDNREARDGHRVIAHRYAGLAESALARGDADFADLLSGGDDYELVFTASPDAADRVADAARSAQVAVSRIGRVRGDSTEVEIRDRDGRQLSLKSPGYRHF